MTRRFSGGFWPLRSDRAALVDVLRPYIEAETVVLGRTKMVPWAIDTGAPYSLLSPVDSWRLLGQAFTELDFQAHPQRYDLTGIGSTGASAIITPAVLRFDNGRDQPAIITMPIMMVEPIPRLPGNHGNWRMPSLLGCDALRHFDLTLSYNPPSVTLTEAAPA